MKKKTIKLPGGDIYVGQVNKGNKPHGKGTITFSSGAKYVGEFKNDIQHGKGTYTYRDGSQYVGEWKNHRCNGQGTFTYRDGSQYVGEWEDDKQNGQGTFSWADGSKYVGEFKNDKAHGKGKGNIIHTNGKYVGELKDGSIRNGQGTYTFHDGSKYAGEWKDGKQNGQGTFSWKNGSKYVGEWKDGKKHGQGTLTGKKGIVLKGKVLKGTFENGEFIKPGVLGKLGRLLEKKGHEKKDRKGYEEIDKSKSSSKKKGGLGAFLLGGLAAGAATAPQGRPNVVCGDPDVVVTKMKHKFGREWTIWYGIRKDGRINNRGNFTVNPNTSHMYSGGYTFNVFFS